MSNHQMQLLGFIQIKEEKVVKKKKKRVSKRKGQKRVNKSLLQKSVVVEKGHASNNQVPSYYWCILLHYVNLYFESRFTDMHEEWTPLLSVLNDQLNEILKKGILIKPSELLPYQKHQVWLRELLKAYDFTEEKSGPYWCQLRKEIKKIHGVINILGGRRQMQSIIDALTYRLKNLKETYAEDKEKLSDLELKVYALGTIKQLEIVFTMGYEIPLHEEFSLETIYGSEKGMGCVCAFCSADFFNIIQGGHGYKIGDLLILEFKL
jgi:hypothetical protein